MEIDLNYHPKKGVSFDCTKCKPAVMAERRCKEDRWDFTPEDDPAVFPIYITPGSELFTFCPGKATWDRDDVSMYRTLKLSAESGNMWVQGGIADQPEWWVELLSWFLPLYKNKRIAGTIRSWVGDPSDLLGLFKRR